MESSALLVQLYEKAIQNQFDDQLLSRIETLFLKEQNLYKDTRNRFIWRVGLLRKLFVWKDQDYQDLIDYMILQQILSIYQMNQDLNSSKIRIPLVKMPKILETFDGFIKKHPRLSDVINNINDQDHPMFKNDVLQLIEITDNKVVKDLLDWFLNLSETDHKYLAGHVLKASLKRIVL